MISKIMKSLTFPSKSAIGKLIHLKGKYYRVADETPRILLG